MIVKLLCAAALVAAPVPASAPMFFMNYPLVSRVMCDEGRGSAFRVGQNHWLSVAHVTAMHNCSINGMPITVTEQDGQNDFSRLDTPVGIANGFKINCDGFKPGHWYWSAGYAHGAPFQTVIALYATYLKDETGKRVLIGPYAVIPGMSGGVVMDEDGSVVGTVNAYIKDSERDLGVGISFSRDLRDTSVCQKA